MAKKEIELLVAKQEHEDSYILDDQNVILVTYNSNNSKGYMMIHERLIDGQLVEINKWPLKSYYFGMKNEAIINDLNLFQVQNGIGDFNALYNYKEGKFVVPQNVWKSVECGNHNNYLKIYNGFLAKFEILPDYEKDDVYSYINPVTNEKIVESFDAYDRYYYALLNIDGTIRGNKLFKGDTFSKITQIIDLDEYESLAEFKEERKQLCNDLKQKKKQKYYQLLESRNDGNISPYLDNEVADVLNLKK